MGLFFHKKEGGMMDALRCDEKGFVIWKWRPQGQEAKFTRKENAIRYGSSLTVRPGQAAYFFYPNKNGAFDIIKGPYSGTVETENLPMLASLTSLVFNGGSPMPAELYYINQEKNLEIPFMVPFFRVVPAEKEFRAYDIQVAIKGSLVFEFPIQPEGIKHLLEIWGTNDIKLDELDEKLKELITQETKQIVANAPKDTGIFIMHFNSLIGEMGKYILARVQQKIFQRFGVIATDVLISDIRYDEESESYQRLKEITEDQTHKFNLENEENAKLAYQIQRESMRVDADVRNATVKATAQMQLEHQEDILSRMREEGQFAQHEQTQSAAIQANLGSQSAYINAHALNRQAEVMQTGLENMGQMGSMNLGGGDGHMNPAGMMTGMMMGTAVAGQMGNMMQQMGNTLNQNMAPAGQAGMPAPPPLPTAQAVQYYVVVNGQQFGPCDMSALQQLAQTGQINAQTMAWAAGMAAWTPIASIPQLACLFTPQSTPTPPPLS